MLRPRNNKIIGKNRDSDLDIHGSVGQSFRNGRPLMKKSWNLPIGVGGVRVFDWEICHFSVSAAIKTKDNAETAQSKLNTGHNGLYISIDRWLWRVDCSAALECVVCGRERRRWIL